MAQSDVSVRVEGCNTFQDCNLQALPLQDLLKHLFLKHKTTGCVILNTYAVSGDCNDYEPALACGTNEDFETLLRKAITIDECGNPALAILDHSVQV